MNSDDPASLQNLNDIVMPSSVPWWPLATGWYVLMALLLLLLGWAIYQFARNWIANRYRRSALKDLQALARGIKTPAEKDVCLKQIPPLLKRTALSVYPRGRVAGLSGESWYLFLNSTTDMSSFTHSTFETLNQISYSTGDLGDINEQATSDLVRACEHWLKRHRAMIIPEQVREA